MLYIAICDDDPVYLCRATDIVRGYFSGRGTDTSISTFTSAQELLNADAGQFNIFLLDVMVGQENGILLAKHLRQMHPDCSIIFISSYLEFALKVYHVNAFRYLLKNNLESDLCHCLEELEERFYKRTETLDIKPVLGDAVRLALRDVLYFESSARLITAHMLAPNQPLEFYGQLTTLEQRITHSPFVRIHQSFLVNMQHITSVQRRVVTLADGTVLTCSRAYYTKAFCTYMTWREGQ